MKIFITFLVIMFLSSIGIAETINFKDGRSVMGKISQRDSDQIKVDVNGLTMTYYVDEIKDIDGKPLVIVSPETPKSTEPLIVTDLPVAHAIQEQTPEMKEKEQEEKRVLILQFIDVFGTRKAMKYNFDTLLDSVAKQKPEEAQKIRDRFKIDEIIERLIPLYDKNFTIEDLKYYISFYSSARGQRLISSIGNITRESVAVGIQYLKEKFPELVTNK